MLKQIWRGRSGICSFFRNSLFIVFVFIHSWYFLSRSRNTGCLTRFGLG